MRVVKRVPNGTKAWVAGAIFLACCCAAFALNPSLDIGQYARKSWNVREGFFKGPINTIVQTPDGYLWIGTDLGLYRFDGVRSVPWQSPSHETLPSKTIRKLFVARDGTLWIGTQKGLASAKGGKLTLYPEVPAQAIDAIAEDSERTIWAGIEEIPAWRLCAIKNGATHCFDGHDTLGLGKGSLLSDRSGNLWAGTGTGLWRWNSGAPKSISLSGPASEIHALIEDDHGAVLASTRGGIIQIVGLSAAAYPLPDYGQPFNPFSLLRDRDGGLWIGTKDRGLLHVHQGRTDHFDKSAGLSSNSVADLFEDREGNVWVGTAGGLDRFREFAVSTMPDSPDFTAASVESVLTARDGSIWLGTRDGLDRWQDGRLTLYRKRRAPLPSAIPQINEPGLPDDFQSSLYQDHRGRVWVFSRGGAAYLDERGRFIRVPRLPGGYAHSVAEDSAADLWISQDQGFFHWLQSGKVEEIPWGKLGRGGLALALAADPSSGGLWLGFSQGGVAYFKDGRVRQWYTAAEGLGEGRVNHLQVDPEGTLWVATEGGLSRLKSGHVNTLSSQNGLPCNSVHDFVEDNTRSMWVHTGCGLVRIARSDLEAWSSDPTRNINVTVFDSNDGLTPVALPGGLSPRMSKSTDGKIWFVSGDGISVIDPNHLPSNKVPPAVDIEQITADNKTYSAANGMLLPAQVRDLAIDYTALSLVAPEKVRFRYKLEGQDKDWREVVNDRQVQYSNLPPGHYRFRVIAANNSGVWNQEGASLDFVIPPAWFQTNWFRGACVAFLLAFIGLAYRLRIREIEEREKKFREAVESMPALAFIASSENDRTFVNKGWVEYTGLTLDLASGSGWQAAVHPEDLNGVLDKWRAAVTRGEPIDYELRMRHAVRGEYRWFHTRVVPLRDKHGKIVKWCGIATDIEDRKQAEEKIKRHEAELRQILDLTPLSVAVFGPDRKRLYANRPSLDYVGMTLEQWQSTRDPLWFFHPDDRERVARDVYTGPDIEAPHEFEARFRKGDGTYRWFLFRDNPVRDEQGRVTRWYLSATDIEDRRRMEEALRRSEAYLAESQRLTHTGSWASDGVTREPRYWSEEMFRIYGLEAQPAVPTRAQAQQRIHAEDHDKVKQASDKAFLAKVDVEVDFRLVLPDGTVKHVHSRAHPVLSGSGELVEVVGTTVDVTERKRLEQLQADLAHTNRVSLLGELAASIAHELKQPITGSITNARVSKRWLKREQPDLQEVREALDRIENDGARATEIIDRLRSLYKKTAPKREMIDVNEIISEMVMLLRSEASGYGVSIRSELARGLPKITADRVQIQQVLVNLMLNGIEAMKDTGGVLRIQSQTENEHVVVTVSDTGAGLSAENANRVFDAFFTTKPQGSGMGLAISRSIVESHGGRIWATGNDGRGATFHFTLPVETPKADVSSDVT